MTRISKTNTIIKAGVIGSIIIGGLIACNDDNNSAALNRQPVVDSSAATVVSDNTAASTNGATAGNNAAAASGSNAGTTAAATAKPGTAAAAAPKPAAGTIADAHAKKRMSMEMPVVNTGAMSMDKDGIYNNAQVLPKFPGGQRGLDNYINNHITYPDQAIDNDNSGTVRVSFVVDEQGNVSRAQLLGNHKLGDGLDEQAIKVVNKMPRWTPGKVNGKNVKTRLELPISFQTES